MDGQGGGIGAALIKGLRESVGQEVEILALGTNSTATTRMMKAGANRGATGENAIVRTVPTAQLILGPLGIIMAHAMMGEVSAAMAEAVSASPAHKILLPLTQERVTLLGASGEPLPHLVQEAIGMVRERMTPHV